MKPKKLQSWLSIWLTVAGGTLGLVLVGLSLWLTPIARALRLDAPQFAGLATIPLVALSLVLLAAVVRGKQLGRWSGKLGGLLVQRLDPTREALRSALPIWAMVLLVAAILGPRWGHGAKPMESNGLDLVVAVDVSRSMLAQDVPPSRLERVKEEVERLMLSPSNRLGLLAFAGSASMKCPLTLDYAFFRSQLENLEVNGAPRGGTALAEAIYAAGDFFSNRPVEGTRAVLLFTDGEDHEGDPYAAAQTVLHDQGVHVYTIIVGDPSRPAGAEVPGREGRPLVYQGQIVYSKPDPDRLQRVATAGGGRCVALEDFRGLLRDLDRLERSRVQAQSGDIGDPIYQFFVAAALGLLTAQTLIGPWRRRAQREAFVRIWQQEAAAK